MQQRDDVPSGRAVRQAVPRLGGDSIPPTGAPARTDGVPLMEPEQVLGATLQLLGRATRLISNRSPWEWLAEQEAAPRKLADPNLSVRDKQSLRRQEKGRARHYAEAQAVADGLAEQGPAAIALLEKYGFATAALRKVLRLQNLSQVEQAMYELEVGLEKRAAKRKSAFPRGRPVKYPQSLELAKDLLDQGELKDLTIYKRCKAEYGDAEPLPSNYESFMRNVRRHLADKQD